VIKTISSLSVALTLTVGLCAFGSTKSTSASPIKGMIVGGENAAQGEFPYIVSLRTRGRHFCGGSLIHAKWVLTAAHCIRGATVDQVWIGLLNQNDSASAEKMRPVRSIVHEQYSSVSGSGWDFALIELPQNSSFAPVSLVENEIVISDVEGEQTPSITAGWGTTSEGSSSLPNALQKVAVPLVSQTACNAAVAYNGSINDSMICAGLKAGGKDSCQGDSGGPLLVKDETGKDYLAGVVSWGQGCARPNKYGVYSKVSAAFAWINQKIQ